MQNLVFNLAVNVCTMYIFFIHSFRDYFVTISTIYADYSSFIWLVDILKEFGIFCMTKKNINLCMIRDFLFCQLAIFRIGLYEIAIARIFHPGTGTSHSVMMISF